MKGLKRNDQTKHVSLVVLALYIVYGMFNLPLTTFVVSLALCGIVYSTSGSFEYGVMALLMTSLVLPFLHTQKEGFKDSPATAAEEEETPTETPKAKEKVAPKAPSTKTVTGAAGASTQDAGDVGANPSPVPTFTGSSTPASANSAPVVTKKISEKGVPPANMPADLVSDGFEDKADGGLFKLGKIPTDEKGGFHIDTGTSVLNALKSLKPDQITAMTQDTKQLIETQKTLMNMLQSFKPMMSEGKEMMDTFQQMFSSKGGSALGALQTAHETLTSQ